MSNPFFGGIFFSIIPILTIVVFVVVFGLIIFRCIQGAKQWKKNNNSPVLTVPAKVVAKRTNVTHHHHNGADNTGYMTTSSTTYYATFEVESGDRMEFQLKDAEYGMLAEGDRGSLTFQGTRYLEFQRKIM